VNNIIDNCKANIERITQSALELNAIVIVTTIIPPTGEIPLSRKLIAWSDNVYNAVINVNQFILSMAGGNVIVFDAASLVTDDQGKMKLEYSSDHLHLNDAGYQILNNGLVDILKELK